MDMPKAPRSNHGFYLLGERAGLLSHIPMFMPPHEAQLFLEVVVTTPDGSDPATVCAEDRRKTGAKEYVLVSEPLILPQLGPDATPQLRSFTGKLYRGWPFDDLAHAPVAIPALAVRVSRSLHYSGLVGAKPLGQLSYYCFQTAEGRYLAHVLTRPPDFDQVLTADVDGLADGGVVRLELPGVANAPPQRLVAAQSLKAVVCPGGREVAVRVGSELIYDAQHLATAMPPAS